MHPVGVAQQEDASVNRYREAAGGEDGRELLRTVVDLDDEPFRPLAHIGERSRMDDLAAFDDHHRVADPFHLFEVVGRNEDVHAELGADAPDEIEHLRPLHRVEPVGRLVEEDQLGVVCDRSCELDALSLPRRHRSDRAKALLAEPDEPERVVRTLHSRPAGEKVHFGQVPDEVGGRELRRQIMMLRRVPDASSRLDSRSRGIAAEDCQLAVVARAKAKHDGDERRLARTIRAQQPRDSGADVGVQARERDRTAEALDDATCRDDGRLGLSHGRGRGAGASRQHDTRAASAVCCHKHRRPAGGAF